MHNPGYASSKPHLILPVLRKGNVSRKQFHVIGEVRRKTGAKSAVYFRLLPHLIP